MFEFFCSKKYLIKKIKVLKEKNKGWKMRYEDSYSVRTMQSAYTHYHEMAKRERDLQSFEVDLRKREIAVTTLEKVINL